MKPVRTLILLFLMPFLFLLSGCGVKIVPKPDQEGIIDARHHIITKEKDGLKISARSMEWHYDPNFLEEYFTPIYFLIKNETEQKVDVSFENFLIFDDKGNQYNAVAPDKVNELLLTSTYYPFYPSYPYYPYTETIIIREREGTYTTFGFGIPFFYYYRTSFGNIMLYALPEGEIHPNAQVRGFVYFAKAIEYGKELKLKVKADGVEQEFEFIIKKWRD